MRFTDPIVTARAHYRDRGDKQAPILLLLHGSNASLFTWEPWSKVLSDHFRVISVDLPGHGLTGATGNHDYTQEGMSLFVFAFADKLGLKSFALAGNSMGGGVAARFAEEHPDRVSRLILVDAAGLPFQPGSATPLAFRLARMPVVNRLLLYITPRSVVTEGLNDAIVHKAIITSAMIDSYWDFARMEDTREATLQRFAASPDSYVAAHIRPAQNAGPDPLGRAGSSHPRRHRPCLGQSRAGRETDRLSRHRAISRWRKWRRNRPPTCGLF